MSADHFFCVLAVFVMIVMPAPASLALAEGGRTEYVIVQSEESTAAERHAVSELAQTLKQITGVEFEVRTNLAEVPRRAIVVGPGRLAAQLFPEVPFSELGPEEIVLRTQGQRLLIAGGRPRGTLYAVARFLQEYGGARWWTPWASTIPRRSRLTIPQLKVRAQPAFESRDPYWFPAFDRAWAVRNTSNSQSANLDEAWGGSVVYQGFVHTFYALVPPEKYFREHPEWFSLIKNQRTAERAQLCLSNPQLRDFVVQRVQEWLRESPRAKIVSVSQNDWHGACECPSCQAKDDAEGSPAGSLIDFVNYVAEKIEPEFPQVAVDTLAYQYTRPAPKTMRPRPNVIVRLCSIEGNFGAPLDDPSNAAFAKDLRDWSKICRRLYVWDYTTDFSHYQQPHPNWFNLGPNARFFQRHHVVGLFEQGAYQSSGAEMAELRAWLLAQLMWNPYQDDRALIEEFLRGYYGRAAAPFIREYLNLMQKAAQGYYLTCYSPPEAPFLGFETLAQAERLWQRAEAAVMNDPDQLWRVRQGQACLRYAWLLRWSQLQQECRQSGGTWPLPESRKAVADEWFARATQPGPTGWKPVTHLNERGLTPESLRQQFQADPPNLLKASARFSRPPAPLDIPGLKPKRYLDLQDNLANFVVEPDLGEFRADPDASDGFAFRMPGNHRRWGFSIRAGRLPVPAMKGRWQVYVVARVDKTVGAGTEAKGYAFEAGVYDEKARKMQTSRAIRLDAADGVYRSFLLGTVEFHPGSYLWAAPAAHPQVQAVWVDRFCLVP